MGSVGLLPDKCRQRKAIVVWIRRTEQGRECPQRENNGGTPPRCIEHGLREQKTTPGRRYDGSSTDLRLGAKQHRLSAIEFEHVRMQPICVMRSAHHFEHSRAQGFQPRNFGQPDNVWASPGGFCGEKHSSDGNALPQKHSGACHGYPARGVQLGGEPTSAVGEQTL
jgi:hypothetical protein